MNGESTESVPNDDRTGEALARLMRTLGRLKFVPRTGWLDRGVDPIDVESVADHSFRVALLAWLASANQPELDRDRVLKLALIHDMAEAVTGDLTPYASDEVSFRAGAELIDFLNQRHVPSGDRRAAKRAAESRAIEEMTRDLPAALRDEIAGLWTELEERTTPEAKFVKQADKLETYLQSLEYLLASPGLPVASFAAEVEAEVDVPALIAIRDAAKAE
jgi:putative hydrolase of HD superfamily